MPASNLKVRDPLDDFERRDVTLLGQSKTRLRRGQRAGGDRDDRDARHLARRSRASRASCATPASPSGCRTCSAIRDACRHDRHAARLTIARACISREFRAFAANASSPVTQWLRALAAHAHPLCGGKGVGAIGMCFTGNFALSMMLEPAMLAPVLSQPSLPMGQAGGHAHRARRARRGEGAHGARGPDGARVPLRGRLVLPRASASPPTSRRSAIASRARVLPDSAANPERADEEPAQRRDGAPDRRRGRADARRRRRDPRLLQDAPALSAAEFPPCSTPPVARIAVREVSAPCAWSEVLARLRGAPGFWLLDSALADGRVGRWSFAGAEPYAIARVFGDRIEVEPCRREGEESPRVEARAWRGDPFEALRAIVPRAERSDVAARDSVRRRRGRLARLRAGRARRARRAAAAAATSPLPDAAWLLVDRVLAFEHASGRLFATALGHGARRRARRRSLRRAASRAARSPDET